MLQERVPLLSAHHGDHQRDNNLRGAIRVADVFEEIDIYEVDFVSVGKRLVSSHDYNEEAIANGSDVEEWIQEFAVRREKILWLDIKQNLDLYLNCGYSKFRVSLLFHKLEHERKMYADQVDIRRRIWIGCQDGELRERIIEHNRTFCGGRWHIIWDMPTITGYILQRITPSCFSSLLCDFICRESRESRYQEFDIVTIDRSFFSGRKPLIRFILSLELRPDVLIVLNSFGRQTKPVVVPNHRIVMQYDYTVNNGND